MGDIGGVGRYEGGVKEEGGEEGCEGSSGRGKEEKEIGGNG